MGDSKWVVPTAKAVGVGAVALVGIGAAYRLVDHAARKDLTFGLESVSFVSAVVGVAIIALLGALEVVERLGWTKGPDDQQRQGGSATAAAATTAAAGDRVTTNDQGSLVEAPPPRPGHPVLLGFLALSLLVISLVAAALAA